MKYWLNIACFEQPDRIEVTTKASDRGPGKRAYEVLYNQVNGYEY